MNWSKIGVAIGHSIGLLLLFVVGHWLFFCSDWYVVFCDPDFTKNLYYQAGFAFASWIFLTCFAARDYVKSLFGLFSSK